MDKKTLNIPGTSIGLGGILGVAGFIAGGALRGALTPILGFTTGLLLSQITSIAEGLSKDTIQNWVKRGFVSSPKNGKFYNADQVARILIINSLRHVIELEDIKAILEYITGSTESSITEKDLLEIFNALVAKASEVCPGDLAQYEKIINNEILNYAPQGEGEKTKLKKVLVIMLTAYHSSMLKEQADTLITEVK